MNLFHFAHPPEAENNGMMESWNDGLKKTIRKAQFFIESAVFRFPFPVFQHSTIPSFHAANQEDDRKKLCNSNRL
jgi:hypothetical protein